ncbi:hypothetical protein [Herbaspirillum rhizosphaerae]|uniref:hypothetical protein n=1 Tax=Herbaspirillum rhizosphaerae TaxID=346179 RepID=UPI0012ED88EA|nr:hypothetical protein [Herbaspirillum rhizosphaerae]
MDIFFAPYHDDQCCLCGSSESLTGEHKIKASALRKIFGNDAMVIGKFDGKSKPRPAQGPKSSAFHFAVPLCASCNSTRTQAPDCEFDRFHALVSTSLATGRTPDEVFNMREYEIGSEPYLNVFRYFAKLLCCHVAESGGPRPLAVSEFALGNMDRNVVLLHIDADPIYAAYESSLGENRFAGHGGLIVPVDAETELATGFRSSIILGAVRYIFFVRFDSMVGRELRTYHHDFWLKCEAAYRDAVANPISEEQRYFLGV